jgi:hypothetical protein
MMISGFYQLCNIFFHYFNYYYFCKKIQDKTKTKPNQKEKKKKKKNEMLTFSFGLKKLTHLLFTNKQLLTQSLALTSRRSNF